MTKCTKSMQQIVYVLLGTMGIAQAAEVVYPPNQTDYMGIGGVAPTTVTAGKVAIGGGKILVGGSGVFGTDPGGNSPLRVGGDIRMGTVLWSGGDAVDKLRFYFDNNNTYYRAPIGGHVWQNNTATNMMSLTSAGVLNVNSAVVIGTDPGGTDTLRVAGNIRGAVANLSQVEVTRDETAYSLLGAVTVKGMTNGNKRMVFGFDTTNNTGYLQAFIAGDNLYPIKINPNGGATIIGTDPGGTELLRVGGGARINGPLIASGVTLNGAATSFSGHTFYGAYSTDANYVYSYNHLGPTGAQTKTGHHTIRSATPSGWVDSCVVIGRDWNFYGKVNATEAVATGTAHTGDNAPVAAFGGSGFGATWYSPGNTAPGGVLTPRLLSTYIANGTANYSYSTRWDTLLGKNGGAVATGLDRNSATYILRARTDADGYASYTDAMILAGNGDVKFAGGISAMGNVAIGTFATPPTSKLAVAGAITAQEIKVTSTGADYVFDDSYKLMPLPEVAAYVKREKRLPEMMSAKDMQAGGMPVGEVVTKQLAKIEELTLHAISLQQENEALKRKQEAQDAQMAAILARLEALERH